MKVLIILTGLLLPISSGLANKLQDNDAYAILQNCMAAAEQTHNANSDLDRYCIDSYLATQQPD